MFVNFTEEARKILMLAKKEMYELKHSYIGTEHVLLAIMHTKNNISKKLQESGLTYESLKEEIIETIGYGTSEQELFIYTPLLKRVIETAILNAKENNSEVTIEEIFTSILEEGDGMAYRILLELNINLDNFIISTPKNRIKKNKKLILDIEMNMGQMVEDVKIAVAGECKVDFYGRPAGYYFTPEELYEEIEKRMKDL